MRKVFVVSYDFADPDPERCASFFETLKGFHGWWHYLSGTWLVATDLNASQIFDRLRPHIDDRVNVLVIEAGEDVSGWLPKKAWEWIKLNQSGPSTSDQLVAPLTRTLRSDAPSPG